MSLLSGDFFKILYYWLLWIFTAMQAFSSCHERGLLLVAVCRLLIAGASLMSELQLQACGLSCVEHGLQFLHAGSAVGAHRLESAGSAVVMLGFSCSAVYGIFPDQGSGNPCPLHWLADSQPNALSGNSLVCVPARILQWVATPSSRGIFPTRGSNPHLLHLLHCQAGSLPLGLPGKPLDHWPTGKSQHFLETFFFSHTWMSNCI